MKRGHRVLSVGLSLIVAATVAAGCGGGTEGNESEGKSGDSGGTNSKKLEISVADFDISKAFPNRDSDEFLKWMENKFNVKFVDKVVTYSDYQEKYQLWSASGELPDVFSHDIINTETYYAWINQGIIRALPADLSKYPNVQKVLSLPDTKTLQVNGKFYMIPRLTYPNNDMWALDRSMIVRKDWMEKLNLKDPVTYEDYLNMFKAFAHNDPDGNGKNDTVGLTFRSSSMLLPVAMGTFPQAGNGAWVKEGGKYIPYFASAQMNEVVKQLRQMYTEGAIDPDFAIMKTNDGLEKFGQGKAGAISMQATPNALARLKGSWNKYNKDIPFEDVIKIIPVSWASPDGSRYRFTTVTFWSESYFSAKVDDEKMDRILQIYDFLLSDEFATMRAYGLEGKDFKREGDKIVITRPKNDQGNYVSLAELYPSLGNLFDTLAAWNQQFEFEDNEINRINYGEQLTKMSRDALKEALDNAKAIPTNYEILLMYTPAKAKLNAIKPIDDVTKVMLSKEDPVAQWTNIVKGYDGKGLQEAIKEVNEKVQKEGLDK